MKSKVVMTTQELKDMIEQMERVFSVVRLLAVDRLHQIMIGENDELQPQTCQCYAFWNRGERCENCVSAQAYAEKGQCTKLEFIDSKIYQVIAKYLEVDGKPYILELITCLDNDFLLDTEGREELLKKLSDYKKELYTDALTGVYNRRYFEEKLKDTKIEAGVAMIDMDDFKLYNDTYGHGVGDKALLAVVRAITQCIRKTDRLVRFGGDEFLLVMPGIDMEVFAGKLHMIQDLINHTKVDGYLQLKMTVSIGGTLTNGMTIEQAVHRADEYMYQAKVTKNNVVTEVDEEAVKIEAVAGGTGKKKYRILIVDDSEINRAMLAEMLKDEFEILEAEDGETCLEMLYRYETKITLILLDIVMPGIDGFDVLSYMNRNELINDIPVIMISSEDSADTIRQAYELGVSDYINRPFDAEVVHRRVVNTIKLYAKQRRLVALVTNQVYEKEKNNRMLTSVLSQIVEFRNGESGLHVLNINTLTSMLLEQLIKNTDKYNLTWMDRIMISNASSLHDIGKIGIDEKILNKKGRLTPEERKIMEKHTVIGADLLANLKMYEDEPLMKTAWQICRWHHERYDGKGYPDGLVGEEIPIAAQVVALADVYDALTSERVYKKAFSHEKSIEMIKNGECGAFNPLLLETMCDIQDKIKTELQKFTRNNQSDVAVSGIKKFEKYDDSQGRFFGTISQEIQKEYGTAGEDLPEISRGGVWCKENYDKWSRFSGDVVESGKEDKII